MSWFYSQSMSTDGNYWMKNCVVWDTDAINTRTSQSTVEGV